MTKLSSSTLHGGNQKSSKSVCSVTALARWIFILSIGCGCLGLSRINLVAIQSLEAPCKCDMEEFKIKIPQKDIATRQTQTESDEQQKSNSQLPLQPSGARETIDPPLHDRHADPISEAWTVAMKQAEKMLAGSTLENAACLVPDTRRTENLVRKLLSEHSTQRKIEGYQPAISPLDNRTFDDPLVPLPILNVGMPKLGSTSLYQYFKCKGLNATHWNMGTEEFEGLCMRDAVRVGLPPLSTCANGTHAIMQMDVAFPMGSVHDSVRVRTRSSARRDDCFFPQLSILEEFHAESPYATLVLTFRPMHDWTKSVTGWHSVLERLQQCHLPNLPRGVPDLSAEPERDEVYKKRLNHTDELEAVMAQFFCSHILHVRNFVKEHPTHTLIELDLYADETPRILDKLFPSRILPASENNNATLKSCWDKHTGGFNKKNTTAQRQRKAEKRRKDALRAGIELPKSSRKQKISW